MLQLKIIITPLFINPALLSKHSLTLAMPGGGALVPPPDGFSEMAGERAGIGS